MVVMVVGVVSTEVGLMREATIRSVGRLRTWDAEGLREVKGIPWDWNLGEGLGRRSTALEVPYRLGEVGGSTT